MALPQPPPRPIESTDQGPLDKAESTQDSTPVMSGWGRLARTFFDRETSTVARDILGRLAVQGPKAPELKGRIVETEAF